MPRRLDSPAHALTRRAFVGGALALGASALAVPGAGALAGCSRGSDDDAVHPLDVATNAVVSLEAFSQLKHPSRRYTATEVITLDAGTQLFGTGTQVAAALCTGSSARPLMTASLLDLSSGKLEQVLDAAVLDSDGCTITSLRASDALLVWTESNFLTGDWAVYSAEIDPDALTLGTPAQLDQGTADYDVPEIACIGSNAYWIVQPAEDGARTSEDSLLKVGAAGAASVLHTSHGRFNGGLSTSGNVLTAMPRADTSGVYYQLTAFQAGSGAAGATQVMPRSFKPTCAVCMDGAFSFGIGASYDYGGGIASVGTYYPLSGGEWLCLERTPVTPAGLCRGWFFCKSGSRTVFVNLQKRTYFTVDAPDGATSYGDYSICTGEVDALYNYATVSRVKGSKQVKSVVVRRIRPRTSV